MTNKKEDANMEMAKGPEGFKHIPVPKKLDETVLEPLKKKPVSREDVCICKGHMNFNLLL